MKALIRVTLALAAVVTCPLVSADPAKLPPQAAQAHASAGLAHIQKLVEMKKQPRTSPAQAGVNAVTASTLSGPRTANPYRAYPPSCLADPLPDTPSPGEPPSNSQARPSGAMTWLLAPLTSVTAP